MHMLTEIGLEIQTEYNVGKYYLDVYCEEVHIAFEADGRYAHAGPRRKERDKIRDEWIYDNAGIPVLRLDERVIRKVVWDETIEKVKRFIDEYAHDLELRKEKGLWLLLT